MDTVWTPAKRAICALNLGRPDEIPTFELEFQLSEEFFGYPLSLPELSKETIGTLTEPELEKAGIDLADRYARVYGDKTAYDIGGAAISGDEEKDRRKGLDYCIIPVYSPRWRDLGSTLTKTFRRRLREHFGDTRLFGGHGDGTFAIPDGTKMYEFAYRTVDDPEGLKAEAEWYCNNAIEHNKRQHAAGLDVALLCADYCYNSGPFLSPAMFDEFIFPYLERIIRAGREDGMLMIKHTDGNIMPIIDSLVAAHPHALHSLDPMAGVDIREVKRKYGDKVALCGNVHCAALQTGTVQEVTESAEYCLRYGGENGGYIFTTSNIPFKGMPPERYSLILDIWKKRRKYDN
ncbi:MAG: uroporphyrinogen decarboxylase family protein [Clostridia bacterium]|nr:uroporphyrinogen decarboxylase family protein [Clostridia bacterium]